jgi:hypothetical protein
MLASLYDYDTHKYNINTNIYTTFYLLVYLRLQDKMSLLDDYLNLVNGVEQTLRCLACGKIHRKELFTCDQDHLFCHECHSRAAAEDGDEATCPVEGCQFLLSGAQREYRLESLFQVGVKFFCPSD